MNDQIFDVGWIGLYRSILRHWIYPKNRPFTKYEAWIDLLLMVNFENKKVFIGEDLIECERGQIITSQCKLMSRWKWSKSKLLKFIYVLENDKMCTIKSDNKKTSLTICNYINYQDYKEINKNKKTSKRTDDDTAKRLQKDTTKEIQEIKKNKYSDFYNSEIEKSGNNENYISIIDALYGSNNLMIPLSVLLAMPTQLSYDQFQKLWFVKEKYKISIIQIFEKMQDWGNPKKRTTIYGSFQTFAKNQCQQITEWK